MAKLFQFKLATHGYADESLVKELERLFKIAGFEVGTFEKGKHKGRPCHEAVFSKQSEAGTMPFEFSALVRKVNDKALVEIVEDTKNHYDALHLVATFRIAANNSLDIEGEISDQQLMASEQGRPVQLQQFITDISVHPASYIRNQMRLGFMYPK